ncbi:MAG: hypothetical protein B7Z55_12420 [Planctomycetales bacterium 12-60-4]|nr:MAG: hypothetical protein B7Z55_12420 [Planctomycetales bacterium 12-60-4]
MRAYHAERYRAGNIVLAVSGRFDWDEVQRLAQSSCGSWPAGTPPRVIRPATPQRSTQWISRGHLQQEQIVQLTPAPSATDDLRFAAELLTVIVGDDSNSRLYWELVDPGDADSAEISYSDFEGAGAFLTYLSGEPDQTASNLERIANVCATVNQDGVTADELELAKNKVSTRIVLRGERPMGRLSTLGHDWLIRREYRSVDDDLKLLNSLTLADLRRLLDQYPLVGTTTVGVGPLS